MIFYQMLYGKKPFGEDQSQEMYTPHPTDFPHSFAQDVCTKADEGKGLRRRTRVRPVREPSLPLRLGSEAMV